MPVMKDLKLWARQEQMSEPHHHKHKFGSKEWMKEEMKEPWHKKSLGKKHMDFKMWVKEESKEMWHK